MGLGHWFLFVQVLVNFRGDTIIICFQTINPIRLEQIKFPYGLFGVILHLKWTAIKTHCMQTSVSLHLLVYFWLHIVFLRILKGEHSLRLKRAVYRDTVATAQKVNFSAACQTRQHFWGAVYLQYTISQTLSTCCLKCAEMRCIFLNQHPLSVPSLPELKVGEMLLSYHRTVFASPNVVSPTFFRFVTLKTSTDPDIHTSWFLASSLQDSDNTISVFFAVEKQTGLWTDHYINSFLKGGSYFKKKAEEMQRGI